MGHWVAYHLASTQIQDAQHVMMVFLLILIVAHPQISLGLTKVMTSLLTICVRSLMLKADMSNLGSL